MGRLIACVVVVAGLALGCASPPPESGTVVEKKFQAEYETYIPGTSMCVSRDYKTGVCTAYMPMPGHYETRCRGGCFWLRLEECDEKGECRRGDRRVPESTWSAYEVGNHYPEPQ